jgi:hypothetical protein
MKRHWEYLKYILKHKWFVFIAGKEIKASLFLLIIHDWSKFLPSEWIPYANTFYKKDGTKQYVETPEFNVAWLHHLHWNKHHWQHWVLKMDSAKTVYIEIPKKYMLEMIADWMGAGRTQTGKWEVCEWYKNNKDRILLHPKTAGMVSLYMKMLSGCNEWLSTK